MIFADSACYLSGTDWLSRSGSPLEGRFPHLYQLQQNLQVVGLDLEVRLIAEQWADALHQWLGVVDRRIQIIHTGKDVEFVRHYFARKDGPTRDFLIISYTFVTKMRPVLEEVGFKFVVRFSTCPSFSQLTISCTVDLCYKRTFGVHLKGCLY